MSYSERKFLAISLFPSVITTLCGGIFSFAISSRLLCLFYHSAYVLEIYRKIFTESLRQENVHRNKEKHEAHADS